MIYGMSEFDALDMLRNDIPTERIAFGVVIEDQFGLGLVKRGTNYHLLAGQGTNSCLAPLDCKAGDEVVVFFKRELLSGKEVVMPSEIGKLTPAIEKAVRLYQERKSQPKHVFDAPNDWF